MYRYFSTCIHKRDKHMDYKKLIIELLDKLNDKRYLKYIYQLIKTLLADD